MCYNKYHLCVEDDDHAEKGRNILKIKLLKIWALLATGVLYTLILTVCRLLAIQYITVAKVMICFIGLMIDNLICQRSGYLWMQFAMQSLFRRAKRKNL